MDNLTHSLAGALLGQIGLKRLSGRAMPTLIIAANLPDIDALATLLGPTSLAVRRGVTHGPIALLLLPLMLTAAVIAWDRWRPRPHGPPVRPAALLMLAYIGTLSHPALDWLNSYGVRFLEPFSSQWFAGDTPVGEIGKHVVVINQAILIDFDEAGAAMGVRRLQDVGEIFADVDPARHEAGT